MIDESMPEFETDEKVQQSADQITLTMAAHHAAIQRIKNELKLSSSLQVHSSDGSLISVFNTEAASAPESSTDFTDLETSIDLPFGDPSFLEQFLTNHQLSISSATLNYDDELFKDLLDDPHSFEPLTDFDPNMTIQELTNLPMESDESCVSQELSCTPVPPSPTDERTMSSCGSPSEDSERDDMNRRGVKKSGGPVRKLARFGNKQVIKYSEDYHDRRVKNNEAVKKSRMKAKEKQKSGEEQMSQLSEENRHLNDRVDMLMKELQVLRSLYKELKHDLPSDKAQGKVNTH